MFVFFFTNDPFMIFFMINLFLFTFIYIFTSFYMIHLFFVLFHTRFIYVDIIFKKDSFISTCDFTWFVFDVFISNNSPIFTHDFLQVIFT